MASDLSKYLGNKLARWLGGSDMPSAPASIYVAFFDGDPKASGVEVTADIRAAGRVSPTWTVPASNDTDNTLVNSAVADFGPSDNAVDASHVAIFDASTSGNRLASKAIPGGPLSILAGQNVDFQIGDLEFELGA